jgi:hypothetical protein
MEFVARQPIFDARRNVTAYELLFRNSEGEPVCGIRLESCFTRDDVDYAKGASNRKRQQEQEFVSHKDFRTVHRQERRKTLAQVGGACH